MKRSVKVWLFPGLLVMTAACYLVWPHSPVIEDTLQPVWQQSRPPIKWGMPTGNTPAGRTYLAAWKLREAGRNREALNLFRTLRQASEDMDGVYPPLRERAALQEALCLESLGKPDKAAAVLDKLLSSQPVPPSRAQAWGHLNHLRQGHLAEHERELLAGVSKRRMEESYKTVRQAKALAYVLNHQGIPARWQSVMRRISAIEPPQRLIFEVRYFGARADWRQATLDHVRKTPHCGLVLLKDGTCGVLESQSGQVTFLEPEKERRCYTEAQWPKVWSGQILEISQKADRNAP